MQKRTCFCLMMIFSWQLFAENVFLRNNATLETVAVENSLSLGYGSKVSEIRFENKNPKITKITLEGTAFIQDYSFIAECKELEILVLNDVTVENLEFLSSCKQLRILVLDSVPVKKLPNFARLENLEYIAMTNCNITDFSNILCHGEKLRFVNLCHNKLSELPHLDSKDKVMYFVAGNPVTTSKYKNYIFDEEIQKKLPDEFLCYIR